MRGCDRTARAQPRLARDRLADHRAAPARVPPAPGRHVLESSLRILSIRAAAALSWSGPLALYNSARRRSDEKAARYPDADDVGCAKEPTGPARTIALGALAGHL